jgi:hypothetical protein
MAYIAFTARLDTYLFVSINDPDWEKQITRYLNFLTDVKSLPKQHNKVIGL